MVITKRLEKKLFRENIEVAISSDSKQITFVGGLFVDNANIEDTYNGIHATLLKLRFNRVTFKWMESADKAYGAKIDSPNDSKLLVGDDCK